MTHLNDAPATDRALIVSSDGHATARMRDYRPYLDPGMRPEFDEFCPAFDKVGMTTVNPKSLANRIDPELVQQSYAKAGAFITENFDAKAPSGPGVEAGRGYTDNSEQIGKLMADEQVADSNGAASKALLVSVPSYPVFVPEAAAYQAEIAKTCPGCSVTPLNVTLPQLLGGQLIPTIVSAVKRTPGISYIVSVNATFVTQLPPALAAAGLAGKFKIIGGPSQAADQQAVLNGTVLAAVNSPYTLGGWQDVDMAIRKVMNMPIPQGDHVVPTVLLTKADIGTPENSYDIPSDYAAQFKKLWLVGS
jgi:hypothetical protein